MKKNDLIRLLVVDDHFFVRMGLAGSLNAECDMTVVAEAEEDVFRAVQAGVAGYLPKGTQLQELLQAVRAVHVGARYLPPAISARLASRVTHQSLSAREMDVLRLIVDGRSNKEIGSQLNIAETTVKLHVRSLLAKLGVDDRTQATIEALRRGLVHL